MHIKIISRTDEVVAVADEEGKPWIFTFNSDPGLDIAITPTGEQLDTHTPDGSGPAGVPEVLWFTMLELLEGPTKLIDHPVFAAFSPEAKAALDKAWS